MFQGWTLMTFHWPWPGLYWPFWPLKPKMIHLTWNNVFIVGQPFMAIIWPFWSKLLKGSAYTTKPTKKNLWGCVTKNLLCCPMPIENIFKVNTYSQELFTHLAADLGPVLALLDQWSSKKYLDIVFCLFFP